MLSALLLAATIYTLPSDIHWTKATDDGLNNPYYSAYLRGKASDKCGQLMILKLPSSYRAPWHTNHFYAIYTILKGTLILGFAKNHDTSAERPFPAGSVIQGLATEPHYGVPVGETIFTVYFPCGATRASLSP